MNTVTGPVILDPKVLDTLDTIQAGLVSELIQLFFAQMTDELQKLESGLAESNWELMWQTAHSLKSAAGNLGAFRFSESCLNLEKLCRYQKPTTASVRILLNELQAEQSTLAPQLKARLTKT